MVEQFFRRACVETPLYSKFKFGEHVVKDAEGKSVDLVSLIERSRLQFDCHCILCESEATFVRAARHTSGSYYNSIPSAEPPSFFVLMKCTRRQHPYLFLFRTEGDAEKGGFIEKVGMFPSMEDIASSDLKKYRGLISKEDFSELHRAGGLASHAIGIGSFVYLRRIFEKQIAAHYQRRVAAKGEIDGFEALRTVEKIEAIADFLPEALVKHRSVYGILSKGIHELDETTCLSYFQPLRQAIIMILEQDYQIREREKAAEELTKSLAGMLQALPKD